MTIRPIIFEKILFGEFAPWRPDNTNEKKFHDILYNNVRANKDNPEQFFNALNDSLRCYYINLKIDDLPNTLNIANLAKFTKRANLQTDFNILTIPPFYNKSSEFYNYLINNECKRIRISIFTDIEKSKTAIDSEYKVIDVLKNLEYFIEQTSQISNNDKLSVYVLNSLKISLFRLYEEVKTVYPSFIASGTLSENELIHILSPDYEKEKNIPNTISFSINRFLTSRQDIVNNEARSFSNPLPSNLVYCSFTYIYLNTQPEYIKDLFDSLKNYNFIDKETTYSDFRKIFSGYQIVNPVIWIGNISELNYFIKLLHNINKSVIDLKQHQWEVACKCFVTSDGSFFDRIRLKEQKKPLATAALLEKVANQL